MGTWEKVKIFKTRLPSEKMSVSSYTLYISFYIFYYVMCRRVEHYSIPYVHNTFNKYCELYLSVSHYKIHN